MRRAWSVAVVFLVVLVSGLLWPAIVGAQAYIWRQRYIEAIFPPTEWSPCPSPPPTGCQCLRPPKEGALFGVRLNEETWTVYATTSEALLCGEVIQHTSAVVETAPAAAFHLGH
jgi:hypothetical protein